MNSSKPFVVFALLLALIVVVGQIFFAFLSPAQNSSGTSITSINLLPTGLDEELLIKIEERANKYLIISREQFENGQTEVIIIETPVPTPTN